MTKTATFVRSLKKPNVVKASVYKLDPPISWGGQHSGDTAGITAYVRVSTVYSSATGTQTDIFPSDETGDVVDWRPIGSSNEDKDGHTLALNSVGYEVVEP